ncbi:MAG: hypothetical protein M1838_003788 [Thelocarpon superellum]|nr:MAG: hypothetical protein M1838_003788 [Thelocarpon superellum]
MTSFDHIPILDLSLARGATTKPKFLEDLRHALLEVGFLYVQNTGIDPRLIQDAIEQGIAFFDLPLEEKLRIEMKNAPSFLGYSRLGNEITQSATDWREQIDLSTPHELPRPSSPLYHNLLAPNQWPSATHLPHFQRVFESYMAQMGQMSLFFTSLVAQALSLPGDAFARFFDPNQQHKLKIVKYPDGAELASASAAASSSSSSDHVHQGPNQERQGVGPHRDSMLTSYLLQASPHRGLQVQNAAGVWIDVPPVRDTFVVAIGQGMEALTGGVCASTTHRVLSPQPGEGPRYSIPFFQGVSYDAAFESMSVPDHLRALKEESVRAGRAERDKKRDGQGEGEGEGNGEVEFTFVKGRWIHLGEATLANRVRSHPDVGQRWYPDLLAQIQAQS